MLMSTDALVCKNRRSPHGERGLKSIRAAKNAVPAGRSPHGERGLKLLQSLPAFYHPTSLPARGAWIEIVNTMQLIRHDIVAPRTGSVD